MSEMEITFGGNKKVNAAYHGFEIKTDQPTNSGGDGSAPAPFDLFLASLGTCAGIFALGFMRNRKLNTDGFRILMSFERDEERHLIKKVRMDFRLPKDFPPRYKDALLNAAGLCTVKRHLHAPPEFELTAD